ALPGIRQVGVTSGFPFGRNNETAYWVEGQPEPKRPEDWPAAVMQSVSENYHDTLGIRLLAGRLFSERTDTATSPPVVIVDDAFVARHFPNAELAGVLG